MNYFIGTLVEDSVIDPDGMKPIRAFQLLSVAFIDENDKEYDFLSNDFSPSMVDDAKLEIIVSSLIRNYGIKSIAFNKMSNEGKVNYIQDINGISNAMLRRELRQLKGGTIWGYKSFKDYTAIDYFMDLGEFNLGDLKQYADHLSEQYVGGDWWVSEDDKYPVPEKEFDKMSALEKAKWNKKFYDFLMEFKSRYEIK